MHFTPLLLLYLHFICPLLTLPLTPLRTLLQSLFQLMSHQLHPDLLQWPHVVNISAEASTLPYTLLLTLCNLDSHRLHPPCRGSQ